jgi:hypothetical protein
MSGMKELCEVERKIDEAIAALSVLSLPIRVPFSAILVVLHGLIYGDVRSHRPPRPQAALSLAGRLSRLVPLLTKCPAGPIGSDARDVHEAFFGADPKGEQLASLLTYAHFADLMAEVHRGYFNVEQIGEQEFRLTHSTTAFSETEMQDILYSEIALAFPFITSPVKNEVFDRLIDSTASDITPEGLKVIRKLQQHFIEHVFEVPLIGEAGLQETFGLSIEQFRVFRGAVAALAEFCTQKAQAYIRRWAAGNDENDYFEYIHWIAPVWTTEFLSNYLHNETGLSPEQLESVLPLLSVDFKSSNPATQHASDGYLPPVFFLPEAVLFGSDLVLLFVQVRNLLFALQRTDTRKFDEVVSKHLEPALLQSAHRMLLKIPFLEIREEFEWKSGEVSGEADLLVYDARTNTILHVQAKAPLPPQGARLVARLETRLVEGLTQLERFRGLADSERDRIISQALGHPVSGVQLIDVLLARSCFGTHKFQSRTTNVVLLTLPLIAGAVTQVSKHTDGDIPAFVEAVERLRESLLSTTKPRWSEETIVLCGVSIHAPMLTYDDTEVARFRLELWRGNPAMGL